MPEFPITYSRRQLEVSSPRPHFGDLDSGQRYWAEMAQTFAGLLTNIDKIQGEAELSTMRRRFQEDSFAKFNEYSMTGDPDRRKEIIEEWSALPGASQSKRGWVNREFQKYVDSQFPHWQQNFMGQEVKHQVAAVDDETTLNMQNALLTGDSAEYKKNADIRQKAGLYRSKTEYEQDLAGFEKNSASLRIKDELIEAVGDTYDKQKGYDLLDKYYKEGLLTAEENKALGDWLDNYVAGRMKKASNDRYGALIQNYKNFAAKLPMGEVTQDDVEAAGFDKDTKALWTKIIKGSFGDTPTSANYAGVSDSIDAVMEFNTLQISKQQAYNRVLKARFIDRSITDDDYTWALARIENPYPKHVTENAVAVMDATEKYYYHKGVGFFFKDWLDKNEKRLLTTRKKAFLSWLDAESNDDQYPDGKTMYEKMREMEVLIETPDAVPGEPMRVAPEPNSPLYVTSDEKYDRVPPDTDFYDGVTGRWMRKPAEPNKP